MTSTWKQFRYRLESVGLRLLAAGVPRLPRRACLLLADALGELYYRGDAKTRAAALENLRVCFHEHYSPPERSRLARAAFRNFARTMLDLFWARRLTPETYSRYMKVEGFEHAHAVQAEHGGVILIEMHLGNYEWVSLALGYEQLFMRIVTMDFRNAALESVFARARCHSGHTITSRHQSMLRLLREVRRHGTVGILTDLSLGLEHPGEVIEAFGLKMHVTFLHALLHQRTGIPIVPMTSVAHPDGTCTITAHPPLTFPPDASQHDIVQGCWDFYEPFIRARPDQWLLSYRHWRNKPRETTADYPAYAYASPKFERALAGERPIRRPKHRRAPGPDPGLPG